MTAERDKPSLNEPSNAENQGPTVEVIPKIDDFTIKATNMHGSGFTSITNRDGVMDMVVRAIQFAEEGGHKVQLLAPDWVRLELGNLGYDF